jgi:hypothetical protein
MPDETKSGRCAERACAESRSHDALIQRAQASLRAASALAHVLSDRLAYACATDVGQLDTISAEHLVQLIAVSDALQDGACRTLWLIEPELAQNGRIIARLARDNVDRR